ncbi:hypothetical protein [Bacillus pacificus]|uniref:hypothetical protein n=1 Tax=Bacillus pacificus TaxID=2026187 RepID=UPI00178C23AA|nr:hypothetical protein [Bacillus pacificus]
MSKPLDSSSLDRNTPKFKHSKAQLVGNVINVSYRLKSLSVPREIFLYASAERRFFRGWSLVVQTNAGERIMKMDKKRAKATAEHMNSMKK